MAPSKISKRHYPETDSDSDAEKADNPFPNFFYLRISERETDHKTFSIRARKVPLGECIP